MKFCNICLRGNSFTGTLSPDMCQLSGLCDIRGNNLTGTIPDNIGQALRSWISHTIKSLGRFHTILGFYTSFVSFFVIVTETIHVRSSVVIIDGLFKEID